MLFSQGEAMQQSSHPAHLEGKVSSSFIPFCAFKSNLILSRNPLWFSNISFPLCSSFKPTMLEGQLCHKIELNGKADTGRVNELMMLLDYNEDRWLVSRFKNEATFDSSHITTLNLDPAGDIQQDKAKIIIDSLSSDSVGFGGGSYKMITVKRMTATPAFLDMYREDRKCDIERFQDCRTRNLLNACNCIPGELQEYLETQKHKYGGLSTLRRCDPRGRECIESKSQEKFNCSVSCEGLYIGGDHQESKVNPWACEEAKKNPEKLCETSDGDARTYKHLLRMVKEYKTFKKNKIQSFDFNSSQEEAQYGEAFFFRLFSRSQNLE